jgi:uncharacterized membrane protein YdbT with pleckstrin-like domain
MILLNEEERLGRKAYMLMALRGLVPPIVIAIIAVVLLAASRGIGDLIFVIAKLIGSGTPAVSNAIEYGVRYVVFLAFALAGVSFVSSLMASRMRYRRYTFTFEEFGLRLRRGTMRMTELTIPYRQMQDVEVERGFFHQITGTARIVINSAGHEEPAARFRPAEETNIILDPIDLAAAEEIRLLLQRKIGVQVVEGEREADREAMEQSAVPSEAK